MKILMKGDPKKERKEREICEREKTKPYIYKRSSSGWTEDPFFLHN